MGAETHTQAIVNHGWAGRRDNFEQMTQSTAKSVTGPKERVSSCYQCNVLRCSIKKKIRIKTILCLSLMSLVIEISIGSGSWSQIKVEKRVIGKWKREINKWGLHFLA